MKNIVITLFLWTSFCALLSEGCGDSDKADDDDFAGIANNRVKRQVIEDRKACGRGDEQPKTRVLSGDRLAKLRRELRNSRVSAFLVPSGDSHQSEYIAPADKRLRFISGFSGSSGFAVVTEDKAALWTDGRYFLQAEDQLDCNWLFMKGNEGGDSGWINWLKQELPEGSVIGADPTLTGAFTWLKWEKDLESAGKLRLRSILRNPIDVTWEEEGQRPERSLDPLEIHELRFAGQSWQDKIRDLRAKLEEMEKDAVVITGLDEVAWLFNLRGKDIPYTPVFRGYAVVDRDNVILYISPEKQTQNVLQHLNARGCRDKDCVQIRDYEDIFEELGSLSRSWDSVILGKKVAYSGGASFAIYELIDDQKLSFEESPVMVMKSTKNKAEIQGMLDAHVRDSVALIDMAARLEDGMAAGEHWDELKVMKELTNRRKLQKYYKGNSFKTISAYGANGAVIHYKASEITNTKIGKDSMFLLDSGGQYSDGTTDVTRTFHFGTPTEFHRETYTRVLLGSIDLARAVFLKGTPDTRMDTLARWHLHKVGLNYRHGTGHGIGAYGLIHESPIQVRVYAKEEHKFRPGQFFSDEPGYYQKDEFGIRLETVLRVVDKSGQLRHTGKDDYGSFYGFSPVCLMPFEPKLIDFGLMNEEQLDWFNRYNAEIRDKVGSELRRQGKQRAYDWMMERTKPLTRDFLFEARSARALKSAASKSQLSITSILLSCIVSVYYLHN